MDPTGKILVTQRTTNAPLTISFLAISCGLGPILGRDFGPNHVPDMGEQSSENEKGFVLLKNI